MRKIVLFTPLWHGKCFFLKQNVSSPAFPEITSKNAVAALNAVQNGRCQRLSTTNSDGCKPSNEIAITPIHKHFLI